MRERDVAEGDAENDSWSRMLEKNPNRVRRILMKCSRRRLGADSGSDSFRAKRSPGVSCSQDASGDLSCIVPGAAARSFRMMISGSQSE